jgi:MFS family permease
VGRVGAVVFAVFALNGLVVGSWAARVPSLAQQIGAAPGALGLSLLGGSLGLIAFGSVAGRICVAIGARVAVLVSALACCAVLPVLGLVTSPLQLAMVLFGLGGASGVLDVSMNVAATTVIRSTGRALMSVFHAAFSFGALAGSAGAAVAAAHAWSPLKHLGVVAVVSAVAAVAIVRGVPVEQARRVERAGRPSPARLVRRPVLWLLGTVALCSAVAEGASGEWSAYFGVHERGLGEAAAAMIFSGFNVAMALTRLFGERVQRRWGPERVLVAGSATAGAGLLIAVAVPAAATAYVGFVLAGIGLAYTFPIALDLAGAVGRREDGGGGEREIGFVTTVAYAGFLAGPPLVGGIAHLTSLDIAIGVVGLLVVGIGPLTVAAGSARRGEERRTVPDAIESTRPG